MSPEQARGESVNHRTDIWSLGVLIYEMISGQRPFDSDYQDALVYSILNEDPRPLTSLRSGIPLDLEHVIQKCLEKSPADRYQHMADLLVDLRHLVKDPSQHPTRTASTGPRARRQLRKGAWIVIALCVLVAASAAIWYLVLNRGPSAESPGENSIAVLPFTSFSKGPDDEIFAEGFHDHLLSQLHGIHGFRVISRQSVIQYKQSQKRSRDIAQELGVAMLMEGSVLRAGDKVRVEAQLIDGKTEGHIWSHTYDGDFRDIFRVQAEIAQQIALSLRTALRSDEKEAIERPLTNNKTAFEYYLKGNHFWESYESLQGNDTALAMYERAAKEDPGFFQAHAMVALACFGNANRLDLWDIQRAQYVRKGELALERATSLDPDNWLVLRAKATQCQSRNENEEALSLLQKALDKQPTNAEILEDLGVLLLGRRRRFEEALPLFIKEYELNPKGLHSGLWVGFTYWKMHRWNDALKWMDLIIAQKPEYVYGYWRKADVLVDGFGKLEEARLVLDEGLLRVKDPDWRRGLLLEKFIYTFMARDFAGALSILTSKEWEGPGDFRLMQMGHLYRMMGKQQEARKCYALAADTLKELMNQRPSDPFLHVRLSLAYVGLHRAEESRREGERAIELAPDLWSGEDVHADFARLNVMLERYDVAIAELDKLLSIPGGNVTVWRLKLDPWYDPLRSDPRFQALLEKYGQR